MCPLRVTSPNQSVPAPALAISCSVYGRLYLIPLTGDANASSRDLLPQGATLLFHTHSSQVVLFFSSIHSGSESKS